MGSSMWGLDLLRLTDYNGIIAYAVANLLTDVIRDSEIPDCRTHGQTFDFLNSHLAQYYKRVEATDRIGELSTARTPPSGPQRANHGFDLHVPSTAAAIEGTSINAVH